MNKNLAWIIVLLIVQTAPASAAESFGRLFFTPEQRSQLDTLRIKKVVATQVKDEPPPEVVSYNGIVRRADGKTTVWVNSKPLSEKEIRDATSLVGRVERDGRILVQGAQGGNSNALRLKVGQSAELLSGQVAEPFKAPTVKPAQATTPAPQSPPESTATAKPGEASTRGTEPSPINQAPR